MKLLSVLLNWSPTGVFQPGVTCTNRIRKVWFWSKAKLYLWSSNGEVQALGHMLPTRPRLWVGLLYRDVLEGGVGVLAGQVCLCCPGSREQCGCVCTCTWPTAILSWVWCEELSAQGPWSWGVGCFVRTSGLKGWGQGLCTQPPLSK